MPARLKVARLKRADCSLGAVSMSYWFTVVYS